MVLFRRLLGDVLRDRRMQRGMTLREVSAEARVSLGYISEIERGQKEASSELLASLCTALEVPLSAVLREVSDAVAVEEAVDSRPRRRSPSARAGAVARSSPPPRSAQEAGSGWQAGHQYVARSRPSGPSIVDPDRRLAPAALPVVAPVDPEPFPLPQVAGRRSGRARSLFWASIWCARRSIRSRSGTSPIGLADGRRW